MTTPDAILTAMVLDHLPRDVDQRRAVLNALSQRLAPTSPEWTTVSELLSSLDAHISQLRELTLAAADRASAAVQIGGAR